MSLKKMMKERYAQAHQTSCDKVHFASRLGIPLKKEGDMKRYVNHRRVGWIVTAAAAFTVVVGVPGAFFLAASIRVESHSRYDNIRLTLREAKAIEADHFKALNKIEYPAQEFKREDIPSQYRDAIVDFSNSLVQGISLKNNTVISPLTAYISHDLFSGAADESTKAIYDEAMGEQVYRNQGYRPLLRTNFYLDDLGSTQLYNGMFFNVDHHDTPKQAYVDFLSGRSVEAFEASFRDDRAKFADWINGKVGEQTVNETAFDDILSEDSMLLGITYLYFNGHWRTPFLKERTMDKVFHLENGQEELVPFMVHTNYAEYVTTPKSIPAYQGAYEYEGYFSVYDRYAHDYTVQYLVPKKAEDSIYELLAGKNFLVEDPSAYYFMPRETDQGDDRRMGAYATAIEFNVPRFATKSIVDLRGALGKTALGKLYSGVQGAGALSEGIDFHDRQIEVSGLETSKQINSIQFNEDGTIAQSIHFQTPFAAGSAAPMATGLRVTLDQPFVYVIRDPNGLPMFIGSVSNPKA